MEGVKACKGCIIYWKCDLHSKIDNPKMSCPCQICIVKGVCKNECDDMISYKKRNFHKKFTNMINKKIREGKYRISKEQYESIYKI